MSANKTSKGRTPFGKAVRDTTRKVAASFIPSARTRTNPKSNLPEPTDTVQDEPTHIEDPEERPTVLTTLASERPDPLADLESLLPVRDTFDDEEGFVDLCNDLLVLNYQEHRDPTQRTIKIPGTTGVYISPNQFYHAWHLLSQRGRDLNGGILADEAGTGKTHVYFAACLLRALAHESKRAVQLYWTGKGRKKVGRNAEHHLPHDASNGRSCPSQKPGCIVCYCVPDSFTRIICDHTPGGVSALFCASESWPDILNMVQNAGLNPSIYQLCLVHNNAPKRFTQPLLPLVQSLSRGAQPDLKSFSPASYIFITTLESPRLRNVFADAPLNVGFSVIDEAHQILRTQNSLTFRMAAEFSENGADVWFVTATPFSNCTLADWVAPMKLIAPRRAAAMRALATDLDTAKSSGNAEHARYFTANFEVVFDRDLVLRHFGTSTFLGKSISDVQDLAPRVISRETPLPHRSAVQELANQVAYRDPRLSDPSQRGLMYLVSLFPAAAQFILEDPITFDTASIRDLIRQVKNRLRIEESEPLRKLADQIMTDSPKLDYILEELNRMGQDTRERDPIDGQTTSVFGAGEDTKMKKMVIITPTVVSAVFLYLALIRHRPDVSLIHNWISAQEKESTVNNFKSLSAAKLVKHNRVLIAPFAAIGTGANLQVASYEILTSPLPDRASQVQAFARTNRSGQRLRPLSHKILALEDSPVDRILLASHATLEIESDPFNISEPLRIAGRQDLGKLHKPTTVVEDPVLASHSSTLGLNEALLFQNALPFIPQGESQESKAESGPKRSSVEADETLLLQDAMFWSPGSNHNDDVQETEGEDTENQRSLLNELSDDFLASAARRQEDPSSWSRDHLHDDAPGASHQPAPRHSSMPTAQHNYVHRPLPPLPTETQPSAGQNQNLSHRRGQSTLSVPTPRGPPLRIDVGPALASRPGQPVPIHAPYPRSPHRNISTDTLERWISAVENPPPGSDPSPRWLRPEDDFSSPSSDHSFEQWVIAGGDNHARPAERTYRPYRPSTPYHPDEPREADDAVADSSVDLEGMRFAMEHLFRMARVANRTQDNHVANNQPEDSQLDDNEQDSETLGHWN